MKLGALVADKLYQKQFDLFVPYIQDLAMRDTRETMERPFFSLAKRKRLKPIEYTSPDGEAFVNVQPHQDYGMATIWDADILIWAVSTLQTMKNDGVNDLPRTLTFHPFNLLRAINRNTGGKEYQALKGALGRLNSTVIKTNIRAKGQQKHRQFHWIESWSDVQSTDGKNSKGMQITLAEWVYEGLVMDGGVLSINPDYFSIKGGRERWLYRVARKHAGGAGAGGFKISVPVLFEKSGVEGTYRAFKHFIGKAATANTLPDFELMLEKAKHGGEPLLRMTKRGAIKKQPSVHTAPNKAFNNLSDATIATIRKDFSGWDIYALKAQFDAWLQNNPDKRPENYEAAFYGFVKRYHTNNKYQL